MFFPKICEYSLHPKNLTNGCPAAAQAAHRVVRVMKKLDISEFLFVKQTSRWFYCWAAAAQTRKVFVKFFGWLCKVCYFWNFHDFEKINASIWDHLSIFLHHWSSQESTINSILDFFQDSRTCSFIDWEGFYHSVELEKSETIHRAVRVRKINFPISDLQIILSARRRLWSGQLGSKWAGRSLVCQNDWAAKMVSTHMLHGFDLSIVISVRR